MCLAKLISTATLRAMHVDPDSKRINKVFLVPLHSKYYISTAATHDCESNATACNHGPLPRIDTTIPLGGSVMIKRKLE